MFLALLVVAVVAQAEPQQWLGTLEFSDSRGLSVGRVTATLNISSGMVTGTWNSPSGASGAISGTINDKGRIKATFSAFGGARFANGSAVPERCQGEAAAEGQLHDSTVIRLTINRLRLDTPRQRARERQCEDMTRVVLLLQPAAH